MPSFDCVLRQMIGFPVVLDSGEIELWAASKYQRQAVDLKT
jgi:hypothetical protein